MAVDILAKNQIVGILEETISGDWGTPAIASSQFKRQYYDVGTVLPDFGKANNDFEWTGATSEFKEQSRRVNDAISGLKRLPFSGWATEKNLADHLAAFFQDVYEASTTPYAKSFSFGSSQYDFAAGEGITFSVGVETNHSNSPESISDGLILENAILDSLQLSWEPLAQGRDKYMKMNGVWVGREIETEQDFSATWLNEDGTTYDAAYSPSFYNIGSDTTNWFTLPAATLAVGGVNMGGCYRRFEANLANNIVSDCVTTGGKPNNYKRNRTMSFVIDLPYNTTTYQAVESFRAGDAVVLSSWTNGTAYSSDGGFRIAQPISYLTSQPMVVEGDYLGIRLEFEAYRPSATWASPIIMSDTQDKGW